MRFLTLAALLLGLASVPPVQAQEAPAGTQEPIRVLLLGTAHLDNPGRDVANPTVPDVLAPQKQRELDRLRDSLAQFRPTKVAIEVQKKHQPALDSLYRAFRAGRMDTSFAVGDFTSVRSEQYQLGFRLAKRQGHQRIWGVDYFEVGMNFGKVLDYARKRDTSFVNYFQQFEGVTAADSLLQHGTLGAAYRLLNRPETVQKYRVPYARTVAVAEDTSYVGTDVVAQYYKRNLHIFANIEEVAAPGDRVLVIFGAGHAPFLRPLIEASPRMTLVDPLGYL